MHELRAKLSGEERALVVQRGSKKKAAGTEASLTGVQIARTEARKSNQRREDRHMRVCESAELKLRNRKYQVQVTNVSSHGTMIEADLQPRIGERVQIAFEGCNRTDCTVRWVRGNRIGLEFIDETVVIAPAKLRDAIVSGRRDGEAPSPETRLVKARAPRQTLLWTAALHWGHGSQRVRVRNISADGAMLEAQEDLVQYQPVVLDLGEGGAVAGRVRWCRSGQIGIAFDERYDLRHLARSGVSPQESSPRLVKPRYLEDETDPDSPWAARWDALKPTDLAG